MQSLHFPKPTLLGQRRSHNNDRFRRLQLLVVVVVSSRGFGVLSSRGLSTIVVVSFFASSRTAVIAFL